MTGDKLKSFQLKNFKAVRDSGVIEFTPLTVFIGSNGSGKSSLIEGLETYQAIVENGLDKAMQQWRGFEYIWNQSVPHLPVPPNNGDKPSLSNPMEFCLNGRLAEGNFRALMSISQNNQRNGLFFKGEELASDENIRYARNDSNKITYTYPGLTGGNRSEVFSMSENASVVDNSSMPATQFSKYVSSWQFLVLDAEIMGEPILQKQTAGQVRLSRNGSNIAEYLLYQIEM